MFGTLELGGKTQHSRPYWSI